MWLLDEQMICLNHEYCKPILIRIPSKKNEIETKFKWMTQEKNIKVVSEVYCFIHVYENACIVLIMLRCWTNPRTINYTIPLFYNTKIRPKLKQRIFSWIVWMSDSNYNKALREVLENTNGYWPPSSFSMHPNLTFVERPF